MTVDVAAFHDWLIRDNAYKHVRMFPEIGSYTATYQLLFHWTLIFGMIGDRFSVEDRWCYLDEAGAVTAQDAWNPTEGEEPTGWHRHPKSGRRRPDGDPAREYVER